MNQLDELKQDIKWGKWILLFLWIVIILIDAGELSHIRKKNAELEERERKLGDSLSQFQSKIAELNDHWTSEFEQELGNIKNEKDLISLKFDNEASIIKEELNNQKEQLNNLKIEKDFLSKNLADLFDRLEYLSPVEKASEQQSKNKR